MREASEGNAVVIRVSVSDVSRIVSNPSLKIEAAYFIPGSMQRIALCRPLSVRIDQTLARGEVQARSSRNNPFDQNETVINPNTGAQRQEPDSVKGTFIGPQRLVPPTPQRQCLRQSMNSLILQIFMVVPRVFYLSTPRFSLERALRIISCTVPGAFRY
jgi:hypothetical protein